MSNILLLGPGTDRSRLFGAPFTGDRDDLWVIEKDEACRSSWPDARYFVGDLSDPAKLSVLPTTHFDEIHAYEILNLLPGPPETFFDLWAWMWDILVPAGQVIASTPHWQSCFIHAYPGPQRIYTPELLGYLDCDSVLTNRENFDELWPEPYSFKPVITVSSTDGTAFYFRVAKC